MAEKPGLPREKQGKLTKMGTHMHVTIFKIDETYPLSKKALEKDPFSRGRKTRLFPVRS